MEEQLIESCETTNKQPLTKQQKKNRRKREAAKRKKKYQLCVNCDKRQFPREIWEEIFAYVNDVKDLQNISCVCQMFNHIIKDKLWNAPRFKRVISSEDFLKLKHLPIKKLNTRHLRICDGMDEWSEYTTRWMDAISQFTQLTSLKLGWNITLTYSDIVKLTALTNLKSLTFELLYIGISKAISQLIYLPLEKFSIENSIFESDVESISKSVGQMSMLRKLEIQTNDRGCVYLSKLSQLEELIINGSDLTIVGCKELCALKLLKKITFNKCWHSDDYTDRNINLLKEANPNLHNIEVVHIDMDDSDDYIDYSDSDYGYVDYDDYNGYYSDYFSSDNSS